MRRSSAPANSLRNLGLRCVLTIVWLLLLGEIVLRLFVPATDPPTGLYVADPDTVYRNAPDAHVTFVAPEYTMLFDTNGDGLRESESVPLLTPGKVRILCLGDSFTFGWGVARTEAFPAMLNSSTVEAINAGVPSYGTDNEVRWLAHYGWRLAPQVVLVTFHVGTDIQDAWLGPDRMIVAADGRLRPKQPSANWLSLYSRLFALLQPAPLRNEPAWAPQALYQIPAPAIVQEGWMRAQEALDALRAQTFAHAAQLVLVAAPAVEQATDGPWARLAGNAPAGLQRDRPQRQLALWSARAGVPFVDLLPAYSAASATPALYYPQDTHWTAAGQALAAKEIQNALASYNKPVH